MNYFLHYTHPPKTYNILFITRTIIYTFLVVLHLNLYYINYINEFLTIF